MMQAIRNHTPTPLSQVSDILLATRNFNRIQSVCNDALENHKMVSIIGDAGYGKTKALKHFQIQRKNVFYLTAKPSMTAKDFWESIFDNVSAAERAYHGMNSRRALYFTLKAIASMLSSYENSLLVIDEAGKLKYSQLHHLHELRDATEDTTGIVLSGPSYFKHNIDRWAKSGRVGMNELQSRIARWEQLIAPERSEIKEVCRHYGVVDPEIVRRAVLECSNYRSLTNFIREFLDGNLTA